jgi:hypothetical protein
MELTLFWNKIGKVTSNVIEIVLFFFKAYQALLLTCTNAGENRISESVENEDSEMVDEPSFKDFSNFWLSLFNMKNIQSTVSNSNTSIIDSDAMDCDDSTSTSNMNSSNQSLASTISNDQQQLDFFHRVLSDGFLSAIFTLLSQLNFEITEVTETSGSITVKEAPLSGDVTKLVARNPKDFLIFCDLVGFCELYLEKLSIYEFESWILLFGERIIHYSNLNHLVSGFYKMFTLQLRIISSSGTFSKIIKSEVIKEDREVIKF